ncbi:helix-turn-helix transcriptional regulator [Streptomyces sp. A7024]|uniref:Helix-turn-helix transcriptional regulator n=1 Tax=Streptomyces coryli TaxID=1128680 RepID=A0A6G4U0B5_9ACTN|nr:helix-turn-helix transcriptional regulator [Streptomyces coryli]NGN64818.1 helix-turn-helix transcriptional regulator [Streptomyces coryli]
MAHAPDRRTGWRRDLLLEQAAAAPDASALFGAASARLRRLLPYDAAIWRATDPVTGLMTAPIRVENLDEGGCAVYWTTEARVDQVIPFRALAGAASPVAALGRATGGRPEHAPLYEAYLRPRGLGDELRAVLRTGGRQWGAVSLFRRQDRPAFSAADTEFVAGLSAPLASRLRAYARPPDVPAEQPADGTGLLLFTPAGQLVSANDSAWHHLADLPQVAVSGAAAHPDPAARGLPVWVRTLAAAGEGRVRVRDGRGRWLVCHASRLDGDTGFTAVVVEPAPPSEVALLIAEAYGLSARELEITRLVSAGVPTAEMAGRLGISRHTVRDHIKAVFAKTGVASRGELVATLFHEHLEPALEARTERVRTD